jgi:hypothetical protein
MFGVGHDDAQTLHRVAGSLEEFEAATAELNGVAISNGYVAESRARSLADIDAGAGAFREFAMTGDKVGVEVGLNDVLDPDSGAPPPQMYKSTSRCGSMTAPTPPELMK